MTWAPTSSNGAYSDSETRVGTLRATMRTNPLLAHAELGKVKPTLFNNPPPDHVFGYCLPSDPEGAREVTMMWKEHSPSPGKNGRPDGSPLPDFTKMNKLAAKSGLTTAKQLPAFRATNMITVKKFDHTKKAAVPLPSNKNAKHTYGMPSAFRTADIIRNCGPEEPPMKHLVQGAYQDEWIRQNLSKEDKKAGHGAYLPPVPTRAVLGHAIGAQKYLQPHHGGEEWKMKKFTRVGSKVSSFMGKQTRSLSEGGGYPAAGLSVDVGDVHGEAAYAGGYDSPQAAAHEVEA